MVRGHAKAIAQDRNQAKAAEKAKSAKRDGNEVEKRNMISKQIKEAGVVATCSICKQGMPNVGALKMHYENKHPKSPLPPELLSST